MPMEAMARKKPGENPSHRISTLNEKALHADLKRWYAKPGDRFEVLVDGFLVDILRPRGKTRRRDLLVEIQTRNLASIRRKLTALLAAHPVRLVYPIPREKWIVRLAPDGEGVLGRRRSPRSMTVFDLFEDLVSLPDLLAVRDFSIEVLFIREEEVRRRESGRRCWRRNGWTVHERRLLDVIDRRLFRAPADMAGLLPHGLPRPFATSDLADAVGRPRWLAQRMAYCLRRMGAIRPVGKDGNSLLYERRPARTTRTRTAAPRTGR